MTNKKERQLKVYSQSGYYYRNDQRPAIFLQGKWLQELGFDIGDNITVKCQNNKLTIKNNAKTNLNCLFLHCFLFLRFQALHENYVV